MGVYFVKLIGGDSSCNSSSNSTSSTILKFTLAEHGKYCKWILILFLRYLGEYLVKFLSCCSSYNRRNNVNRSAILTTGQAHLYVVDNILGLVQTIICIKKICGF